uniref:hypothetical protein n=1 Tax=Candidatus Magnetaquicoccus inordinatus TaxID=2496818 RepID=UPI00102C20A0
MPSNIESAHFSRHVQSHRTSIRIATAIILLLLTAAGTAWHHQRTQPITDEQRATLTALAITAA